MPTGGVYSAGTGLQLQNATPGTQNTGNFNVSGIGIAQQFTTSSLGIGVNSQTEKFGHALTDQSNGHVRNVMVGYALVSGVNGDIVNIGNSNNCYSQTSATLGQGCIAGSPGDIGANKVAVGKNCYAGNNNGEPSNKVAMGLSVSANGYTHTTAVGSNIGLTGSQNGQAQVAFGINISAGNNTTNTENAFFGNGITLTATTLKNALAIGVWDGSGTSGVFPGIVSNQILIGNKSQPNVNIGPYVIGSSTGINILVSDTNHVMGSTEGTVIFMTLTASRTNQLPLASSVPAGYIARMVDMSGAASAVNTLAWTTSGADTLVGPGPAAIVTAYGGERVMSDGVSKWNKTNNW